MTSKLPRATKDAQLFSPEEKRTRLPCRSRMNTGLDVWVTPGLKPLQHVRIKMAFSISSQVLHQFIPSAVTSHQVPHVLFPLHFVNLIYFFFLSVLLFKMHPFSLLPGPVQQQLGGTAREKSCSSTHVPIRHTLSTLGRWDTGCWFCFGMAGIAHLSANVGCVKHMKMMIFFSKAYNFVKLECHLSAPT